MSYSTAETLANRAASTASAIPGKTNDQAIQDLARSIEYLSKAVYEIAHELKSDQ